MADEEAGPAPEVPEAPVPTEPVAAEASETTPLSPDSKANGKSFSRGGSVECSGACSVGLLVVVFCAVGIASAVIGLKHLDDCPIQPHIPIMLVALGALTFLAVVFDTVERRSSKGATFLRCVNAILKTGHLVVFIYACVLVYKIHSTVKFTPGGAEYCHDLVYNFAFWFLTGSLILVPAFAVAAGVYMCTCGR